MLEYRIVAEYCAATLAARLSFLDQTGNWKPQGGPVVSPRSDGPLFYQLMVREVESAADEGRKHERPATEDEIAAAIGNARLPFYAMVSPDAVACDAGPGVYVQAWVWVPKGETNDE
jgi:hypothetical protein